MTKAELIEKISRSRELPPDITKKCIGQILDLAFEELGSYFVRAKVTRSQCPRFTFPAFGTFTKKKRSARNGINPRTLEPMTIEASYTIDFRPGTELRSSLNGRGAAASKPRRRVATTEQLDLPAPTRVSTTAAPVACKVVAEPEVVELDSDADSVLIHRRRFTHREDLDDELDDVTVDAMDRYDLPPAPMQRARLRGAAGARTGS